MMKRYGIILLVSLIAIAIAMQSCSKKGGSSTGPGNDTEPPVITASTPTESASDVPITAAISVTFSEEIAPASLTDSTFTIDDGAEPIAGTLSYATKVATFTPSQVLDYWRNYIVDIHDVTDKSGNVMVPYSYSFSTAKPAGPPILASSNPSDGSVGIGVHPTINLQFSQRMAYNDAHNPQFFNLSGYTGAFSLSGADSVITIELSDVLLPGSQYTLTISGDLKSAYGVSLGSDQYVTFTVNPNPSTWGIPLGQTANCSATDVIERNGSYLVTVFENFPLGSPRYVTAYRVSATGSATITTTLGGDASDSQTLIPSTDGALVIGGSYVTKLANDGTLLWQKTYYPALQMSFLGALQTADGGYILTGVYFGGSEDDPFILKINSTGTQQWYKVYAVPGADRGEAVCQLPDGGYLITGEGYYIGAYLIRVDGAGNQLWRKPIGSVGSEQLYSMISLSDGNFALAGISFPNGGAWQGCAMKVDGAGSVVWQNADVSTSTRNDNLLNDICESPNGDLTTVGYGSDPFIRLNSSGSVLWSRSLPGFKTRVQLAGVVRLPNGDFVVAGGTGRFGGDGSGGYVARVNAAGQF